MAEHNDKEVKNDKAGKSTISSASHTLGSRTDDHYFASSENGSVTLRSDITRSTGRAIASSTDTVSNQIDVLPNGRVISYTHGGIEKTETIEGKLEQRTAQKIIFAVQNVQASGGMSAKEEVALNNLRDKLHSALEDGKLDGADNRDILAAVNEVNNVATKVKGPNPYLNAKGEHRTADWKDKKGQHSGTVLLNHEHGSQNFDTYSHTGKKEFSLSRSSEGDLSNAQHSHSVTVNGSGEVSMLSSTYENGKSTYAAGAIKRDYLMEETVNKVAKAFADAERSGGISPAEAKALNNLRETIGSSLTDGRIDMADEKRIAQAAQNVSKVSNKGQSR